VPSLEGFVGSASIETSTDRRTYQLIEDIAMTSALLISLAMAGGFGFGGHHTTYATAQAPGKVLPVAQAPTKACPAPQAPAKVLPAPQAPAKAWPAAQAPAKGTPQY
jgi:hypothetical protein